MIYPQRHKNNSLEIQITFHFKLESMQHLMNDKLDFSTFTKKKRNKKYRQLIHIVIDDKLQIVKIFS